MYCFFGINDFFLVFLLVIVEFLMIFFFNIYNVIFGFILFLGESCCLESLVEKYCVYLENI